jgi:hypothetical protein
MSAFGKRESNRIIGIIDKLVMSDICGIIFDTTGVTGLKLPDDAFDLSSCHEKANFKCEGLSDTKNVIDYSKKQVEMDIKD